MKWLAGGLIVIIVFVTGAFYGIDKTNEKLDDRPAVVTTPISEQEVDHSVEKQTSISPGSDDFCASPNIESGAPWISKLAGGMGQGVASSFNGVIVVLSEIIQAGE
ncbi:hypothetical protein [Halobacillus aidingensis]|uniref:Uncharacterized protein n=1 Tax=Halobacillus aidingensis TaxID=240303 RepID=A0A1H0TRE5_HALAD|nr:hypothetical protein [Halobacillus aidingensis]SDP56330.1 hypothetical protein SAMN05421677_12248 [Halobacillus aidingensis]